MAQGALADLAQAGMAGMGELTRGTKARGLTIEGHQRPAIHGPAFVTGASRVEYVKMRRASRRRRGRR